MATSFRFKHKDKANSQRRGWWGLYLVLIAIVITAVIVFRQILLPFIFALITVYLLAPLVKALQERGLPRWGGVLVCYALIIALFTGSYAYLAPKLRTESVKVLKTFKVLLAGVPEVVDRVGADVVSFLDKLEGRPGESMVDPATTNEAQAAQWGWGPTILPVPVFETGAPPGTTRLQFTAEDRELSTLSDELTPSTRSNEEIQIDRAGSQMVFERIADGVYGVTVNESTLEIRDSGDGTYTVVPHAAPSDEQAGQSLRNKIVSNLRGSLERFAGRIVGGVISLIGNIVGIASNAIVALVVLFMVAGFILVDYRESTQWFRSRVPSKHRADYDDLIQRLDAGLSGVIRGQLIICVINGILSGIGFLIFIPDYALVFAVFAGVMSIIPIFGTIISTVPAVLIGLTVSFGTAVAVLVWILAIHALEANILNPKIIASQARLPPVLVVFALIAGEFGFGIIGALLAVPVLSVMHSVMGFLFLKLRPHIIET